MIESVLYQSEVEAVRNPDDLQGFLKTYFLGEGWTFLKFLQQSAIAEKAEFRFENVDYLRFLARVSLMTAEFGYYSPMGYVHAFNHRGPHIRGLSDPVHLLALAGYMADLNLRGADYKRFAIDYWQQREGPNSERDNKIWGAFLSVNQGKIDNPPPAIALRIGSQRMSLQLPVCIPDLSFHRSVAQIGLTHPEAEKILAADFHERHFPQVERAFAAFTDPNGVFFSPQERWH